VKLLGVNLTPIVVKHILSLENLRGKSYAVDANNYLYQFLALVRMPDGTPLKDSRGNITSHLAGLISRTTRLMHDYNLDMIFIFDGKPPDLKKFELSKRREVRETALKEWEKALEVRDYAKSFSKAVVSSRLTQPMVSDAKRLLELLGVPCVQAPSEAEAQAAYMSSNGSVWASSSKDYDSLLFGALRLVRYLTLTGKEYLPSKKAFRQLKPELIVTEELLDRLKISHTQLIDVAILIGTDFNQGIKGVGPKKALELVKSYGKLEKMPSNILSKLSPNFNDVREIFAKPEITSDYKLGYGKLKDEELYHFLCDERNFSRKRVETAVTRMKEFYSRKEELGLDKWLT
jgi:flap endonuclease-1